MGKKHITKTEEDVKRKLGISNFRELSKDKVIQLFSMLDELDPEVSKSIIAQFPNFSATVLEAFKDYGNTVDSIIQSSKESSDQLYKLYNRELDILERILDGDLTYDQKLEIADRINKVTKEAYSHEQSNKEFWGKVIHTSGQVFVGLGMACLAALGYSKYKK